MDTIETTEQTEAPVVEETKAEATPEAKPEKAPKVDPTKPCYCSTFEITDPKDESGESTFTTGCESTTKRTFAQGHDARLVSFLVDGQFDGYEIRQAVPGESGKSASITYPNAVEAAATASPALREKAIKAVANRTARDEKKAAGKADREAKKAKTKAEKEAKAAAALAAKQAKANAPKDDKVTVVPGSQEGDPVDLTQGVHTIKVGRREFEATIDANGAATYRDEKSGSEQTIERDGYRLLK